MYYYTLYSRRDGNILNLNQLIVTVMSEMNLLMKKLYRIYPIPINKN